MTPRSHRTVLAPPALAVLAVVLALVTTGCSPADLSGSTPETNTSTASPEATTSDTPSTTPSAAPSVTPTPDQPRPRVGECRALGWKAAVAPVSPVEPRRCSRPHTAETFHVGRLDLTSQGHRLAVDSPSVQAQPAATCPARLPRHLGVSPRALRLSMAQAVWFTPSVEDASAGADWFRCDVVVVAGPERLLPLPRRTTGLGGSRTIAMCGTAEPGTERFARVACARPHSWRAVTTVDLPGKTLPSAAEAADRMSSACRSAARSAASDPLDFNWSEERPTQEQWDAGRRYGICWVPTRG